MDAPSFDAVARLVLRIETGSTTSMSDTVLEVPGEVIADEALLAKYELGGPRYACYPTTDRFSERFGPADALHQLRERGRSPALAPLSMYVHLPFCESGCFFCECDKVVSRDRDLAADYLGYLEREIATQRGALGRDDEVGELHWGGGTPTFLTIEEVSRLMECLRDYFRFLPEGEYSIEVDPRRVAIRTIENLGALGFNRLQIGVQDFDPAVQEKVNRPQPVEDTVRVMMAARSAGFRSVGLDLIYGLPAQSVRSVARTLETAIRIRPDRISLYGYVHLPALFRLQRRIEAADLPAPKERARILSLAVGELAAAGYRYLGMGHFALPEDDLAQAQARGALHRSFQGYSSLAPRDLLSFGVSAISAVGATYGQNHRELEDYCGSVDRGELPVARGHRLDADDLIRRDVIRRLACDFRLDFGDLSRCHGIDFGAYFGRERARIEELEREGLVACSDAGLQVTPRGRLLVHVVCMAFDRYLRGPEGAAGGSRAA